VRWCETALFGLALAAELFAAGLVCLEIRVATGARRDALKDAAATPLTAAVNLGGGIVNRWVSDELLRIERERRTAEAERLEGTIRRQRWAFVFFVIGAFGGCIGSLLTVWG
jgi:hypothetical protein